MFNMDGDVIGINSQIFSPSGGSVGIGFAIPSNLARDVVQQLRQFGVARRGWIGVRIQPVTDEIAQAFSLPSRDGALIADVTKGGPAAKAGLANGDLVTSFDGKPITDNRVLPRIVANTPIGKTVNIDVLRKGRKASYRIMVEKLADDGPADKPVKAVAPPKPQSKVAQLGLALGPLDDAARGRYKIAPQVQGVVVTNVDPGTAAGDKNMRPGDVIVQVQGAPVKTPDDIARAVDAAGKSGKPVALFLVSRGGDVTYVGLRLN